MINTGLKNGLVYEVKYFHYMVGAQKAAEIEVLLLDDGLFGSQAKVYTGAGKKGISSGKTFDILEGP